METANIINLIVIVMTDEQKKKKTDILFAHASYGNYSHSYFTTFQFKHTGRRKCLLLLLHVLLRCAYVQLGKKMYDIFSKYWN